jgi:hypothetical protein
LKIRIAIVVIGLLSGLVARVAVEFYQHHHGRHAPSPPAATATPLTIKSDHGK